MNPWRLDGSIHDQLATGRKIRILTNVDTYTRFSPALELRFSFRVEGVVAVLGRISREHGLPKAIRVDQGTEFVSRDLDLWACQRGVVLDFSRPRKPTDNPKPLRGFDIESLNGKLRAECLSAHWFMFPEDARRKMEDWRRHYNEDRPHSAIGYKPPITLLNRTAAHGPP